MASMSHLALFLAALLFASASKIASVSAVQKVIELLEDMQTKAQKEKNEEATSFSAFTQFCSGKTASTEKDISKGKELVESLTAGIDKLEADTKKLSEEIGKLHRSIETAEAGIKEAKEQRAKDRAGYTAEIDDYGESVDALEQAIAVLQKASPDRKQNSAALLQLTTQGKLPEPARRTVAALLEMESGGDFLTRDAPEANAYEFQSSNIVDLLKKLRTEFKEKRTQAEQEEMNSRMAHEMMTQDLGDQIEGATSDIADRTVILEEKKERLADDKKRLSSAQKDLEEDVVYLTELKTECKEKTKSFNEKQELRAEEIRAIGKAIEILGSPDVMGSAEEHLPALAQRSAQSASSRALAQVRSEGVMAPEGVRRRLIGFLRGEGMRLRSNSLSMLADKVATTSDPFKKVKKMIEHLIDRLLQEINEETEHKGFCDKEVRTNKITRTKLSDTVDTLTAKVDDTQAAITEATQRLEVLSKEVSELQASMQEATELRSAEKAKNADTMADAKAAQKAVAAARTILRDFYKKAAAATALLQAEPERIQMGSPEWQHLANPNAGELDQGHREGMQTFGETYKGQQDEAGGVLAMLEVIDSDFAALESDTKAAEDAAARAYDEFMNTSKKSVAVKNKEAEMLKTDRTVADSELLGAKRDLASTQDQLLAAERYYANLKPQCVDTGINYADRAKGRKEEIQSLKEALAILKGTDFDAGLRD